jgi:general secretion pathway protein K
MEATCPRPRQKGVALVIVLWILLLITISSGAYTLMARMNQLEAHTVLSGTRARLAAEAAMNIAVLSLRDPDEQARLIPDGRPYIVEYQGAVVEVMVTDERGKLNINRATEELLTNLFSNNGMDLVAAESLAGAVLDWKDTDEAERPNGAELPTYEAEGLSVGPANRNFVINEEILQVLGMSWELYVKLEPGISVFSDSAEPNLAFAPAEAVMALPDMTEEEALNLVEQRQSEESLDDAAIVLPGGSTTIAQGRGVTYSIVAKAVLPNGIWDQVEATIRLGGGSDGRPFRVLRWREGFHH